MHELQTCWDYDPERTRNSLNEETQNDGTETIKTGQRTLPAEAMVWFEAGHIAIMATCYSLQSKAAAFPLQLNSSMHAAWSYRNERLMVHWSTLGTG